MKPIAKPMDAMHVEGIIMKRSFAENVKLKTGNCLFRLPTASGDRKLKTGSWHTFLLYLILCLVSLASLPANAVTINEFTVPTAGGTPQGIVAGPDGNLWFTETWGNKIGRITTAGVITEFTVPTDSSLGNIAAGPDGNLWFTEENGNKIGRITTGGVITEFAIPTAGSYPVDITTGPDGNLWFNEDGGNKIGQITTAGVITEFAIPTTGGTPCGITVGLDGNIWFAEGYGNKIGRVFLGGPAIQLPPDGAILGKPYPYFSWNPPTDIVTNIAKYQLYIDDALARDNIVDGTTAVPSTALSDGPHTWFVRAWDNVGNYIDSATRNLTVNAEAGSIAFSSERDGQYEIYVMNSDGTNQTRLTFDPEIDVEPSFSPDGSKITFRRGGGGDIWIMNADGSNQIKLTNSLNASYGPSFSPDGSKIVFASAYGSPNPDIYVMNANGTNLIRLTNTPSNFLPVYSPDGRRIAFTSGRDGNWEIYIMDSDGANQTRLTNNAADDREPAFSPDGSKIVFSSDRDGNDQIYLMDVDGTNVTRLTYNSAFDQNPKFSPDGHKIVFNRVVLGNLVSNQIYIMNSDGTNETNISNNSSLDMLPDWGPSAQPATDTTPPIGSISINSGAPTTNTVSVTLTLSCIDSSSGCAQMQFSNDSTNWSTPEPYATAKAWTLSSGDGTKTVYAAFKDNAGNWSSAYSSTITLNTSGPTTMTITASAGPNGTIWPAGDISVLSGKSKTFTMHPAAGYRVQDVVADGASQGPKLSYTFKNVTANHTISVSFTPDVYTIEATLWGTGGSISPAGITTLNPGDSQTYTITPAAGNSVSNVVIDGATSKGSITTFTFTNVRSNHTIKAYFAPITYAITATAGPNGSIMPSGTVNVNTGANQNYTISPSKGYHVLDVLVDGSSIGAVTTYAFTNVTAAHTISATFDANPSVIITASAGSNGTISPVGDVSVLSGTSQTFTMTPAEGYRVQDVVVDGVSQGARPVYIFTNITANHTISVSFTPDVYTVEATLWGTGGSISPAGITTLNPGDSQTYTITPAAGYNVSNVVIDGATSKGSITTFTFTNVRSNHTIKAYFAPVP